ncbi:DNA cytosine methyltransferase [Nocardia sp. NPDC004068]|uniref:DNA cytosine methyltransferase n=1 Tax=Nocardia sp. NPDC004068 TaxID=3364303 RepID=UPI0036910BB8
MPAEQPPASSSSIHMVDLFAGPGGLDVAAHWLGIEAHGIEWDPDAVATREQAKLRTELGDVRRFEPRNFRRDRAGDQAAPGSRPDMTILAGGPPCQTYTVAGNGAGRQALNHVIEMIDLMIDGENVTEALQELHKQTGDERTGLVLEPLRWALEAYKEGEAYDVIVLEQVPAVLPVWKRIAHALEKIGYFAEAGVLHAEEYGVPQTRRRAILMARRTSRPRMPSPTHERYRKGMKQHDCGMVLLPWKSMGDALDRRDFKVISNYGTGGDPKARGNRNWDEPSATVTGKISRNRLQSTITGQDLPRFTNAEAGQLQTFPRDYPWSDRNTAQQIGNAIPPRLAVHVLAAALDSPVDSAALDDAVNGSWFATMNGVDGLSPKLRLF